MSETTTDWNAIVHNGDSTAPAAASTASAAPASGAATNNLPPFPQGVSWMIGRLPIKGDTGKAIVQLPEPLAGVHCAAVMVNSSVLSDCYRPAKNQCLPAALRGRPLNDREIEVVFDGGDGVVKGQGWTPGAYPGSLPTTRSVETDQPFVEVVVYIGLDCGCDSENWKSGDDYGQP